MELTLNLGWTAMATAMCWLWVRHARREGQGRSTQVVSLSLVLFIMFAVITMYDDMAMAQNPAEARCFQQREDDLGAHAHVPRHPAVALTPTLAAEPSIDAIRTAAPGGLLVPAAKVRVLSFIQNRPPPAA
jgi:hypothetical protein